MLNRVVYRLNMMADLKPIALTYSSASATDILVNNYKHSHLVQLAALLLKHA